MSVKDKEKRCSLIARLITWFDAEAELIPADVDAIEKVLKDYTGTDIFAIWKDVRDDFVAISTFPSKFQEITRYARSLAKIRMFLLFGSIIAMVFTLLISFHAVTLPIDPTYIIFILFYIAIWSLCQEIHFLTGLTTERLKSYIWSMQMNSLQGRSI